MLAIEGGCVPLASVYAYVRARAGPGETEACQCRPGKVGRKEMILIAVCIPWALLYSGRV